MEIALYAVVIVFVSIFLSLIIVGISLFLIYPSETLEAINGFLQRWKKFLFAEKAPPNTTSRRESGFPPPIY